VPAILFKHLIETFVGVAGSVGLVRASIGLARSARALRFPAQSRRALVAASAHALDRRGLAPDVFFHLSGRHYLSRHLTTRQRIDSLVYHHDFEQRHYSSSYGHQVYGGAGILLWRSSAPDIQCEIRLEPGNDNRWEGELSVVLYLNGARLSVMSFSYVDSAVFGQPSAPTIFIARNQSGREPEQRKSFQLVFNSSAPSYLCLAAVSGIAMAHGMQSMCAIRHDAHPAWEPKYDGHLDNSYSKFWSAFHARALDHQAYEMAVPLASLPLDQVKSKHRKRASDRRKEWQEVAASACEAMARHRVGQVRIDGSHPAQRWVAQEAA
jgi:uncharacterized protein VirK/YbjX